MKRFLTLCLSLLAISQAQAFEEEKYYTINRNGEQSSFMFASGSNIQTAALKDNDAQYVWQLIPTDNTDCYYIKNVATELYVQSSSTPGLSQLVSLGTEPVEYMISTGSGTTGSGTTYFLASTDQGGINYNEDATLGLNKGANGVVAFYIKTGRGNSYWNINEIAYSEGEPTPPAEEEADVCPAISAYRLPCGTYSNKTRLSKIDIEGEGVLTELHYKPTALTYYSIYTVERATFMAGGKAKVTAKLVGADVEGLSVTIWADFNADGVFETSVNPAVAETIEAELSVPATAAEQGRLRIRVDQNGGETANADIYGAMYDLPFNVKGAQEGRTLVVQANVKDRGNVAIEGAENTTATFDRNAEVTISAAPADGYYFNGWRQGRTVISGEATLTVKMSENKTITALFSTTEGSLFVEEEDNDTYSTNFPKNTVPSRSDRLLNSISLQAEGGDVQTIEVNPSKVYSNLTSGSKGVFQCAPAETLSATFGYQGTWMHGYVYIDENHDKQFSFLEGNTDQSGTELKTFSFYSGNFNDGSSGVNSAGTPLTGSARNTFYCPPFQAPAEPGDYRIRFKVDWNSVDAGGQIGADGTCSGANGILANGGFIVDAMLRIVSPTAITEVETAKENVIFTVDGRRVNSSQLQQLSKGVYIVNGQKMLVK